MTVPMLSVFENRHIGERVVVVCNGPSLNKMDLSFLRNETVIGMNKIYLGLEKFRFYPRYYVAINDTVIEQSEAEIRNLNCVKFVGQRAGERFFKPDGLTYFLKTNDPPARFCTDISKGVHEGWTVTYAALQIAYYMGFDEVVIVGMDHHYEYQGRPNEPRYLEGPDPNHFSPDYFGGGQSWDNPDLKNSEKSYQIAREVFENDGRRIIDATVDGGCVVFEKADYKGIFRLSV